MVLARGGRYAGSAEIPARTSFLGQSTDSVDQCMLAAVDLALATFVQTRVQEHVAIHFRTEAEWLAGLIKVDPNVYETMNWRACRWDFGIDAMRARPAGQVIRQGFDLDRWNVGPAQIQSPNPPLSQE